VVSGLTEPTGIAFLRRNDFLVLEKSTGKVKRVVNGVVQSMVLDLAVNSFSERGLLGIALHPDFEDNGFVYLYWTCRAASIRDDCAGGTEDTAAAQVPLLLYVRSPVEDCSGFAVWRPTVARLRFVAALRLHEQFGIPRSFAQ
jgi:hypothetical protein